MAKQSQINRNKKREKLVAQYATKRAELKKIADDMKVPAEDRLSAAIAAERIGDGMVRDPQVEYTHALSVRAAPGPRPAASMAVAAAA